MRTPYPGQAPRLVEDQVTYPLTTALLSVPGATTVRGYSFYGDSFVNVLFEDGTDPYWARSRVLEYLSQATARLPEGVRPVARPGRDRRRLDLPVRARRPHGPARPRAAALAPGLVPEVRAAGARRRGRGRDDRRHGQAVPGRRRSAAAARLRHSADDGRAGDPQRQPGSRRLGHRDGRGRVHGARDRVREEHRRPRAHPGDGHRRRHAGAAARRGGSAPRARDAPRDRRARRRGRGRRRRHRHAQRRQRARHDRARQAQARRAARGPAAGRRDRRDLRPRRADPARRRQPEAEAARRVHRRGAGLLRVPVPPALGPDRRDRHADRGRLGVHRHARAGHQRQHHVARRHRHRDRHAGRRGDRDDRERAQEAGARAGRVAAHGGDLRRLPRGRAVAVLLADDRRALVPAGVHARGAGRPDVRAARVHQDVRDGRGVAALDHAGAGADLVPGARPDPTGEREPGQPGRGGRLPAGADAGACVGRGSWSRSPPS